MRTAIVFTSLFLFASLNTDARTFSSFRPEAPCLACDVPGGLAVSDLTANSATLSWNAVNGAIQYTIEIQDEQNGSSTFKIETNVSGTSYAVTGLQAGVKYKFKVRARCGSDKSDWSEWVFFIAGSSGGGTSDCAVVTGLAVTVAGDTATLTWNIVSGAVKYLIEVEDEQNSPSVFHLVDSASTNVYALIGLQTGVLYKFKVRAHCANGQSDWSNWLFFNGATGGNNGGSSTGCAAPTGLLAANISANSAMLIWDAVPGAVAYTLEIERNQAGTAPWQIKQTVTTNSFLLTGLDSGTRYKFKVRSKCSNGDYSDWSAWHKFKTTLFLVNNSDNLAANRSAGGAVAVEASFEMQVWPNPAQAVATVRLLDLKAGSVTLRLFDLTGSMVREQYVQQEGGIWEGTLTFDDLPNGLYLLQTQNGASAQTLKLMVNGSH